jgi:hypothetical protein
LDRQVKQEAEEVKTCPACGMLNHKTTRNKSCFGNKENKHHAHFLSGDLLTAIVEVDEDYVTVQQQKKRRKEKKFVVPEDLWK